MEIKLIKSEFTLKKRMKPICDSAHPNSNVCDYGQLCENNTRGYNVSFSGKLPIKSVTAANTLEEGEKAAKTLMEKIMNTGAFKWLAGFSGGHNVASASLIALFLAGVLRPPITIALPGKKDLEDKIVAASHSLASATIGFIFSTLITTPIDSGIKHIFENSCRMKFGDYFELSEQELAEQIRKGNITPEKIAELIKSDENYSDKDYIKEFKKYINDKLEKDLEEIQKNPNKDKIKDLEAQARAFAQKRINNIEKLADMSEEDIIKVLQNSDNKNLSPEEIAKIVKENDWKILKTRSPKEKPISIISDKADIINKLKHDLATTTDTVKKSEILSEMRNYDKWIKRIDTGMHNVSEWVIAVPRAMLTIALIPPILKYVFHIEKKKEENKTPNNENQNLAVQNVVNANAGQSFNTIKHFNEFVGGKR